MGHGCHDCGCPNGCECPREDLIQDVTFEEQPPIIPQLKHGLKCADCGADMELRQSKFGFFYGCVRYPECKGTHGADKTGVPLGTPGDAATRRARMEAHAQFDRLWKEGSMTRNGAYAWFRTLLNKSGSTAHIAKLNTEECQLLILAVRKHFNEWSFWDMVGSDES